MFSIFKLPYTAPIACNIAVPIGSFDNTGKVESTRLKVLAIELFQIWLNLPAKDKFADPHYKMFWSEDIPKVTLMDANKKETNLTIIAGNFNDTKALSPPPESWAANEEHEVAICLIRMEPGAMFNIPEVSENADRSLYYYRGATITIEEMEGGGARIQFAVNILFPYLWIIFNANEFPK